MCLGRQHGVDSPQRYATLCKLANLVARPEKEGWCDVQRSAKAPRGPAVKPIRQPATYTYSDVAKTIARVNAKFQIKQGVRRGQRQNLTAARTPKG